MDIALLRFHYCSLVKVLYQENVRFSKKLSLNSTEHKCIKNVEYNLAQFQSEYTFTLETLYITYVLKAC